MSTFTDFLLALIRKKEPVQVCLKPAAPAIYRDVLARISGRATALLSAAMDADVKLVLIETPHNRWIRVVPGSTPEQFDLLETPNLGSIALYESGGDAQAFSSASKAFRKTRIRLGSRKMKRLHEGGWLGRGIYEYVFYRHTFHCITKSGNPFEVAVMAGDGVTLIPDLDCKDLVFDFVSSVGVAFDESTAVG